MPEKIDDTDPQLNKFSSEVSDCIETFKDETNDVLIHEVLKIALTFPLKQDYPDLADALLEEVLNRRSVARAFQFEQLTSMTKKLTNQLDRETFLLILEDLAGSMSLYFWEDKSDNCAYLNKEGTEFPLKDAIVKYNTMSIELIKSIHNEDLLEDYIKAIENLDLYGIESSAGDDLRRIIDQRVPDITTSVDCIFLKANMRAMFVAKENLYRQAGSSPHYFQQSIYALLKRYDSVTSILLDPFQEYDQALINGGDSILVSYTYNSLFLFLSKNEKIGSFLERRKGDINELIKHITHCSRLGNDAIGYIAHTSTPEYLFRAFSEALMIKRLGYVGLVSLPREIWSYGSFLAPRIIGKLIHSITGGKSTNGKAPSIEAVSTEEILEGIKEEAMFSKSKNLRDLIKSFCEDPHRKLIFKELMTMQDKDVTENEYNIALNAGIDPYKLSLTQQASVYKDNLVRMNASFIDSFAQFIAGNLSLQINEGQIGPLIAGLFRQFPLWMFELYLDKKDFDK